MFSAEFQQVSEMCCWQRSLPLARLQCYSLKLYTSQRNHRVVAAIVWNFCWWSPREGYSHYIQFRAQPPIPESTSLRADTEAAHLLLFSCLRCNRFMCVLFRKIEMLFIIVLVEIYQTEDRQYVALGRLSNLSRFDKGELHSKKCNHPIE